MARCTLSACSELLLRALDVLGLISACCRLRPGCSLRAGVFPIAVSMDDTSHFGLAAAGMVS
ncbi:MAG: hypothetical protein CM15mP77_4490 [Synechococcus sp.]|nr:MAG: hypothetical protein CM15mP77_4490 [Synechococcus sp.]